MKKYDSELNAAAAAAGQGLVRTTPQRHPVTAVMLWAANKVLGWVPLGRRLARFFSIEPSGVPAGLPRVSRGESAGLPRGSRGFPAGLARVSRGVRGGVTAIAIATQRGESEVRRG